MIEHVSIEKTTYNHLPYRYEAGTPNIAGAVGLSAALDYLGRYSWEELQRHEQQLLGLCIAELKQMPAVRLSCQTMALWMGLPMAFSLGSVRVSMCSTPGVGAAQPCSRWPLVSPAAASSATTFARMRLSSHVAPLTSPV